MSDHQEQLHEELEQVRVALHQMASEARGCSPGSPSPRAPPTDRNVQVIVEIEARAATVERLFMISERQEWTFGQALEYALDALELALAKTATGCIPRPTNDHWCVISPAPPASAHDPFEQGALWLPRVREASGTPLCTRRRRCAANGNSS